MTAGTATLRDAADGESLIRRVRERTGVELEIVSGETEAWLSYLAVVRGLRLDPSQRLLIIDIGGGSTEFIRAGGNATEFISTESGVKLQMASLQIGSVRLTERILHHDPPTTREAADLRLAIDAELTGLGWKFDADLLVGIAGTVTTVCAIALEMETYDPDRAHGYELSRDDVERVLALLGSMPLAARRKLKGLDPARADVIFAGTAILERVMSEADVNSVTGQRPGRAMGPGMARAGRFGATAVKAILSGPIGQSSRLISRSSAFLSQRASALIRVRRGRHDDHDQGRTDRDRGAGDAPGEEDRRASHRTDLRSDRARDSQGQALLGARLRHLLSTPPPRASGLQSAHAGSDDDPGRAHHRFPSRAKA